MTISERTAPGGLAGELGRLIELSLPMMAAQGGLMMMGVVDTLIVGRTSSLEMAAVALGNAVSAVIVVLGIGLAMGIEPLVAQALGAGEPLRARRWMWQGLYVSLLAAIPLVVATTLITLFFEPFGIPADISERARLYTWSRVPGIIFNCSYASLRAYFSSIGKTRPILMTVAAANVLNFVLDWALVFGELGLPELGSVGAGVATSIAWVFMTALLALAVWRDPVIRADGTATHGFARPDRAEMKMVAKIGWPIGLQIAAEVGIFALVSALIARFGEISLAGHQIAITLASLSFMCAVGIANAASARVGYWIGAGQTTLARRTGFLAIALGGAFMSACGVAFAVAGWELSGLFSPKDLAAQIAGAWLLQIAAVFSLSDGVQVVAAGALRGAGDTRWTFYANFAAHWLVALPLALYLGHLRAGPVGYWWALSAGLTGVAVILVVRFAVLSRRPIARVAG